MLCRNDAQKLDPAGNKLLGDEGVLISYKRTESAAYSKLPMMSVRLVIDAN